MVHETEIPPVPNREQEILMMQKIKESFQKQSLLNPYMNESERLMKIKLAEKHYNYKRNWKQNFLRGALFTFVIATPISHRLSYSHRSLPTFFENRMHDHAWSDFVHHIKHWRQLKFMLPTVFVGGFFYASLRTDRSIYADEYMEDYKVILPY